jgi:hypothetical protein
MTQSVSCLWTNFCWVPASYDSRCVRARRASQRAVGGRLTAARVQIVAELLTSFQTVQRGEQTTRWKMCNSARDWYPGVGKEGAHGITLVSFIDKSHDVRDSRLLLPADPTDPLSCSTKRWCRLPSRTSSRRCAPSPTSCVRAPRALCARCALSSSHVCAAAGVFLSLPLRDHEVRGAGLRGGRPHVVRLPL